MVHRYYTHPVCCDYSHHTVPRERLRPIRDRHPYFRPSQRFPDRQLTEIQKAIYTRLIRSYNYDIPTALICRATTNLSIFTTTTLNPSPTKSQKEHQARWSPSPHLVSSPSPSPPPGSPSPAWLLFHTTSAATRGTLCETTLPSRNSI